MVSGAASVHSVGAAIRASVPRTAASEIAQGSLARLIEHGLELRIRIVPAIELEGRKNLQLDIGMLLGISEAEILRISSESGLGHIERAGNQEEMFFTYEELRKICLLCMHEVH